MEMAPDERGIFSDISMICKKKKIKVNIDRACYVANMSYESRRLIMLLDDPTEHGWEVNGKVKWSVNYFLDEIDDLLLSSENKDDVYEYNNSDALSDEEDD